jgi:aspartate/methionine/tyrosine aminotransferase
MDIAPFALERFFARYEFSTPYTLSSSECEPLSMQDLLALADGETRALWDDLVLGYTESAGHVRLRQAIADLYPGFSGEDILVSAPEEGIFLLMQALLAPGDHVVCPFPGYQSLYAIAAAMGCKVSYWRPAEDRAWRFEAADLEGLLQPDTKLVVVNFPHNPTGSLPSQEEFQAMVEMVRRRGSYLLCDEMYRFLELDRDDPLPAGCALYERAVSLGGLSKSFGLPGLRIGWCATREGKLLARMAQLKDYTTICSSAPSEILALMALAARPQIIAEQQARLRRNRAVLEEFCAAWSGIIQATLPAGGSVCFPRLVGVRDAEAFCTEVRRRTGILLLASHLFDYGRQHVRLGLGRENFPQVLARLGEYLAGRAGRSG